MVDQVLNETEIGGGVLRTLSVASPIIESGVATSKFSAVVEIQDVNQSKETEKLISTLNLKIIILLTETILKLRFY